MLFRSSQYFTDSKFLSEVKTRVGKQSWDRLLDTDVSGITSLDVSFKGITSINGIEYFTNLQFLSCDNNKIASIDVSKLTNLKILHCNANQLTSLKLGSLLSLHSLYCDSNQLTYLDVGGLTGLKTLTFGRNQVAWVDLSKLTLLQRLDCDSNKLLVLDVTGLDNLSSIDCSDNYLTSIKGLRSGYKGYLLYNPQKAIKAVIDIGSVPSSAVPYNPLTLTGVVSPTDATYNNPQYIRWSIDRKSVV